MTAAPRTWMAWALPALLALALFAPSICFDFINYDDNVFVFANPNVTGGLTLENIRWAFTTVHQQWWLPILWISYMLDSEILGTSAWGYHLVNVLLHAANAGLLGWIFFRLTGAKWRAIVLAAIFAAHPLRVEVVAWVTARKDVLSGLFFMLGLLAHLRYVERPSLPRAGLVAAALLLGLMSKGILVIFPFLLLVLDFWPLRRVEPVFTRATARHAFGLVIEKTGLFVIAGLFIAINLHTHISGTGAGLHIPLLHRLSLAPGNVWDYLRLLAWPAHLSVFYPEQDVVHPDALAAALAGLAAITFAALFQARRRPWLLAGWLWFLLALIPILRGMRLGYAAYADRFTYLPSIGLSFALVWTLEEWRTGRFALAAIFMACTLQTAHILPDWRDSIHLFTRSLRATPDNPVLLNNLSSEYIVVNRAPEAVPLLEHAVTLDGDYLPAWVNRALALEKSGLAAESRAVAWQGLARGVDAPFLNLELALLAAGLGLDHPFFPEGSITLRDLGPLLEKISPPAVFLFHDLVKEDDPALRPEIDRLQALYVHLWLDGKKERALHFFLAALAAAPNHVATLNNLAWLLATDPEPPADSSLAVTFAERAQRLAPSTSQASVLDTLAAAQAANGNFAAAVVTAGQARDLAHAAGQDSAAAEIERRQSAYFTGQPWRETAP